MPPQNPSRTPASARAGRAVVALALLVLGGLGVLAAFLALRGVRGGEPAAPDPDGAAAQAPEPPPLVPRLELGMGRSAGLEGERPPLEARPSLSPEERFAGVGRIEGYLDVPTPLGPPQRWTLVLEPSQVLIGGQRAREQRREFEHGETEFTLEGVPLGGYEIRAEAEGMSGSRELLLLARPDAHDVIVRVALRPAAFVEGLVTLEDGEPVADLPLELHPLAGGEALRTRTDARGAYLFERVPDGEHRLFAGHPMSPLAEALDLSVSPPSLHVPPLSVPPLGELEITVIDAYGLPVPGALVDGWGSHGGRVEATTDDRGEARARFLPAGRITLNAHAGQGAERRSGRVALELAAAATRRVEIRLAP